MLFEQPNLKEASVSFHMWNGEGDMPLGSGKNDNSNKVVSSGVMPNLEAHLFDIVPLWAVKDNNGGCRNIGLEYLPSLREVRGIINSYGMSDVDVDAALDTLWNECKVHPNHPTLNTNRWP